MQPRPDDTSVLFLHPGAMGSRLAGECQAGRRLWVDAGRSAATAERAEAEGLEPVANMNTAVNEADVVVSICPPAAAVEVAKAVADAGYRGIYLDANAVAPATMAQVASRFTTVVDGGVIGPPPNSAGTTRLYLADAGESTGAAESTGDESTARWIAGLWAGSRLDAVVIESSGRENPFPASALKMVYAAWTKGSAAMLTTVAAAATELGIADELMTEWKLSQAGLVERTERSAAGIGPKAWRFTGEMTEIASTFDGAGLPDGFWHAANDAYQRLAPLKGSTAPSLHDVIDLLIADRTDGIAEDRLAIDADDGPRDDN